MSADNIILIKHRDPGPNGPGWYWTSESFSWWSGDSTTPELPDDRFSYGPFSSVSAAYDSAEIVCGFVEYGYDVVGPDEDEL